MHSRVLDLVNLFELKTIKYHWKYRLFTNVRTKGRYSHISVCGRKEQKPVCSSLHYILYIYSFGLDCALYLDCPFSIWKITEKLAVINCLEQSLNLVTNSFCIHKQKRVRKSNCIKKPVMSGRHTRLDKKILIYGSGDYENFGRHNTTTLFVNRCFPTLMQYRLFISSITIKQNLEQSQPVLTYQSEIFNKRNHSNHSMSMIKYCILKIRTVDFADCFHYEFSANAVNHENKLNYLEKRLAKNHIFW